MNEAPDNANTIVHPPIGWALAFVAGLGADWLYPVPLNPVPIASVWFGGAVFAVGLALGIWAIVTIRTAGTRVETSKPTTTIVEDGPYLFTRNPIYIGMLVGQTGLAIGFNSAWILVMLVPFYLVIRYGVVAREEAYLERKFGEVYLRYKSRVRRWM